MLFRNCAGGVVFYGEKVFILKNEKREWILPKGRIRNGSLATETAIERVKFEANLTPRIVSTAGETSYEFFSMTRKKPVCNEILWYIMEVNDPLFIINESEGFMDGGFFYIEDALKLITYSQDRALVNLSYKKYKDLKTEQITA
ncbi:NUDIX domain-containing protein [Abyssisolibacter fermentans]|uniref:NUDIX domain-containing protein n=1 Tax=Abyssisolibacter fermentans TaxID=1766203 RepID=UPI0008311493|nr:NUDIX hydrolase [Abyssisolibacter fermentans]